MKIGDKVMDGNVIFVVRKIGGGGQLIDPDTNTGDIGWHICDGTRGTPDLRGRFILGASDSHVAGSTGGEENHTLTVDEMPAHSHAGTTSTNGNHKHGALGENNDNSPFGIYDNNRNHYGSNGGVAQDNPIFNTSTDGAHNHTFTTDNTGGGVAHNNMPPFLYYETVINMRGCDNKC